MFNLSIMLYHDPIFMTIFNGDKKVGKNIFYTLEQRFVTWSVPKIPKWLQTYHLTLLTLVWSGIIVVASYLAKDNIQWLWLVSFMIVCQYLSDLLDGAVGRYRNTGLIKMGILHGPLFRLCFYLRYSDWL